MKVTATFASADAAGAGGAGAAAAFAFFALGAAAPALDVDADALPEETGGAIAEQETDRNEVEGRAGDCLRSGRRARSKNARPRRAPRTRARRFHRVWSRSLEMTVKGVKDQVKTYRPHLNSDKGGAVRVMAPVRAISSEGPRTGFTLTLNLHFGHTEVYVISIVSAYPSHPRGGIVLQVVEAGRVGCSRGKMGRGSSPSST